MRGCSCGGLQHLLGSRCSDDRCQGHDSRRLLCNGFGPGIRRCGSRRVACRSDPDCIHPKLHVPDLASLTSLILWSKDTGTVRHHMRWHGIKQALTMIIHVFRYVKMASNRNEPCAAGLSHLQDPGRHSAARLSPTPAVPVRIAYARPAK